VKSYRFHTLLASLAFASALPACGGAVGEAIRPTDHTANSALDAGNAAKACTGEPKYAKPLIVDLDPDTRVDLEAAMKKGLIVVSYDCASLRVLTGCKLPDAAYEYAGVSRKEQVVQIKNADDLSVNLPLSSAKLSGELKSGRTVDLALVLVGRSSTTVGKVDRDDLVGSCDGATHYVQNATLGAFSMQTGSIGKVAAVAEMFDRGGSASSASERKAMNSDGSLDECRTSNPDAETPPGECRAPLRVELVPIVAQIEAAKKSDKKDGDKKDEKKEAEAVQNPCPPGYAFIEGLCTKAVEKAYVCNPKDEGECKAQCDKGSGESCYNYGRLIARKQGSDAAASYYKKACDAEVADGCGLYGWHIAPDTDAPDVQTKSRAAIGVLVKACQMGSAIGCEYAGDILTEPDYKVLDEKAGAKAYDRGCSLGRGMTCWSLAQMHFKGKGVEQDTNKGISLLNKACQSGNADECNDLAIVFTKGQYNAPKNLEIAFRANKRACELDVDYCIEAVKTAASMDRKKEAFDFAVKSCNGQDWEGCTLLGNYYESGSGTSPDPAKAREAWKKGCMDGDGEEAACKKIGVKMKD